MERDKDRSILFFFDVRAHRERQTERERERERGKREGEKNRETKPVGDSQMIYSGYT